MEKIKHPIYVFFDAYKQVLHPITDWEENKKILYEMKDNDIYIAFNITEFKNSDEELLSTEEQI